jgi:multiple sugar transport system substrate-binding protein
MKRGQGLGRRQFLQATGILSAAFATAGAAAACAMPAAPSFSATQAPQATAAPAARAAQLTGDLVFWAASGEGSVDLERRFNALNNGLHVKWEEGEYDANAKIMAALAAGKPPPVAHMGRWQIGDMAVRNAIVALDSFIAASPTFKWDKLWSHLQADCTLWGKKWTVPFNTDTRAFYYNKQHLAEAGIGKPPETLEEVAQLAPRLTKKDAAGRLARVGFTPSFSNPPQGLMFCSLLWCKGGAMVDPQMTRITFNDATGVAAMQWLMDVMASQGGYKDVQGFTSSLSPAEGLDPFSIGAVSTMMMGNWAFPAYDKVSARIDYGIVPGPHFAGSDTALNFDGGGSLYIFKTGNQQALAWKFVETVMRDDFLASWCDQWGELPATRTAADEWQKRDTRRAVFASTADTCHWIPVFAGTLEAMSALQTGFDNILIGGHDIQKELDMAAGQMQAVLDRHNSFAVPKG